MLYVILALGVSTYLRYTSTQYLQEYLSIDMKMDIYSKFIKNDMYFFEQYKTGEFVSRLGNDINQAKSAVSNNLTFLIKNFVTILANIVFLFVMSWKLTLSVMTILPFFVAVTIYYSKRFKPLVK
jgi:ABC-type multidrug transport system fused ATPase/permease subunit